MRPTVLAVLLVGPFAVAQAQVVPESRGADHALLMAIYSHNGTVLSRAFTAADRSSYPVFYLSVPVVITASVLSNGYPGNHRLAYHLTVSHLTTTGLVYAIKYGTGRQRPYAADPSILVRTSEGDRLSPTASFPSGHASLAFTIATSLSLSHPELYVIIPTMTWASLVALSRLWLGVHYPSDVLAGALLGSGVALAVHALGDAITPAGLRSEVEPVFVSVPLVNIRF